MNIPSEVLLVQRCDADLASGLAVSPPASLTLRHHQYTVQYSHVRAIFLRYTILLLKNDPTLKRYSSKLLADPTVLTVALCYSVASSVCDVMYCGYTVRPSAKVTIDSP